MKKRLLSILVAVAVVLALTVPFATPVLADPAPGSSPVITPTNICTFALPVAMTSMVFHGSGFTATTTVEFADAAHITVTRTPSGDDASHFTATINVAAGASHGMKEFRFKDGAFTGAWVYNEFSVGTFNWPPGSSAGAVGLSITACKLPSGAPGTEYGPAPVHQGDPIYYRLALSVNTAADFDFYGGELSVQFPDKAGYHPTAGYGALTTGFEQIPEVSLNHTFTVTCQTAYFADAADLDVTGHLLAEVDYGPHADNLLQVAGIQEGFSPTVASASVQITQLMVGKLEVNKIVNLSGAPATGVTQNFTVEVTGTGGPYPHTFVVVDGVVQNPNPWVLLDLVPGFYIVSESNPAPKWTATGGGLVEVTSGQTVSSNITNTLVLGELKVLKNDQHGNPLGGSTFTITQTAGGIYTAEITDNVGLDGDLTAGVLLFQNVPPGTYTVSETGVPPGYVGASTQTGVVVNPNAVVTVTFENTQGEIIILKKDLAGNLINLPGAKFQISPNPYGTGNLTVEDNVLDASGNYDTENTTLGRIHLIKVPLGSYSITETQAPTGYALDTSVKTANVTAQTMVVTVEFTNLLGEIIILKKDLAGNLINLPGAKFQISPNPYGTGNLTVEDNVLDASGNYDTENTTLGRIHLIKVPLGSYSITETQAPTGYALDTSVKTANVTAQTMVVTVEFTNLLGEIIILKKDLAGNLINLPGAKFQISPNPYGTGNLTVEDNVLDASGNYDTENTTLGRIHLIKVPLGSYSITETQAPTGYALDTSVKTANVTAQTMVVTVEFTNLLGEIIILKKDLAGNLINLPGAKFQISPNPYGTGNLTVEDNVLDASGNYDTENTTLGRIHLIKVPLGSYSITETQAPTGYALDTSVKTANVTAQTMVVTVEFTNLLGEIIILKKDLAGNLINLPGAKFQISPNPYGTGNLTVEDNVLDASGNYDTENTTLGRIHLIKVPLGSYSITETQAPTGYALDTSVKTANVTAQTMVVTVEFTNLLGEIIILKKDLAGNLINLPGAKFQISPNPYGTGNLTVEDNVLDASGNYDTENTTLGRIHLIKVPLGSYSITETQAPTGYALDTSVKTANVTAQTMVVTVEFTNLLGEIIILKKDLAGNLINLPGAKFQISPNPYGTGNLTVEDNVLDASGNYDTENTTLGRIHLIKVPLGSYSITETQAPTGYALDTSVKTANVTAQTMVVTVEFTNLLGEIIILKKDLAGNLINLPGAKFQISPNPYGTGNLTVEDNVLDASGNYDTENTTLGRIHLIKVPLGSYSITETQAPTGYALDTSVKTANVTAQTMVVTVEFTNLLGEIIILKKDLAGNLINLPGAKFQISPNPYGTGNLTVEDNVLDASGNYDTENTTLGRIHLIKVPLGSYSITETQAPTGYALDTSVKTANVTAQTMVVTVEFTNLLGEIIILKKDLAGNLINLPGAKFQISPNPYGTGNLTVEDNVLDASGNYDTENTTLGRIHLIKVPLGSYSITETQAPTGYALDTSVKTANVTAQTMVVTVEFTNLLGEIIILKKDLAGNLINLPGAKFQISPNPYGTGNLTVEDNVLDASGNYDTENTTLGRIHLIKVPLGSYSITETQAPTGYALDTSVKTANVTAQTMVVTVEFTNLLGEIIILKKDLAGNLINLPGAKFQISPNPYGTGNLTVEDNVLDASGNYDTENTTLGRIHLIKVPLGSYSITETQAPTGYALDTSVKTANVTAQTMVVTVEFTNLLGEIIILKKDLAGNLINLPGAKFQISPNPYGTGNLTVEDNVLDASGNYDTENTTLGRIHLIKVPLGSYSITETQAPTGYALDTSVKTANVTAQTMVVTVEFTNPQGQIKVLKKDQDGAPLFGSAFTITQTAGGSYIQTVTDNGTGDFDPAAGSILFRNVPLGTYTVSETTVPPGYLGAPSLTGIVINSSAVVTVTFTNTLLRPHTASTLTVGPIVVPPNGGDVVVTVSDRNDGNVPLHDTHMHLLISPSSSSFSTPLGLGGMPGYYLLGNPPEIGTFTGEFINGGLTLNPVQDGIMQVGETWTWSIVVHVTKNTHFTVIGHGTDPAGGSVNYPEFPTERAEGQVTVPPPVPASTNLGIGFMIAGFAGAMIYLIRRRARRLS